MNNTKISSLQFSTLMIFPILSLFTGIGLYNIIKIADINAYISTIFSTVFGLVILGIFIVIFNYKKDMTIVEKNKYLFGNILGTIINYIISFLIGVIGLVIIYSVSNFIVSQFLAETPITIILIFMAAVAIFGVTKGIEVIARTSTVFFIIIVILTIVSTLGLIPFIDLSNIKPVLEYGIQKPLGAGVIMTLTNVVPILVMLIIPRNKIIQNKKLPKYIIIAYFISMLFMFMATFLTVDILGTELINLFPHPEYIVLKKISILGFIDRIENIIYLKWLLNDFISFVLIVYYISNNIRLKDKQKIIPAIIVILILVLSQIIFNNNTEFKSFVLNVFPYFNLLLLIIFIIIFMNVIVRKFIEKEA